MKIVLARIALAGPLDYVVQRADLRYRPLGRRMDIDHREGKVSRLRREPIRSAVDLARHRYGVGM